MVACTFVVFRGDGQEPEIRVGMLQTLPSEGTRLTFGEEADQGITYIAQELHFTVHGTLAITDQSSDSVVEFPKAQIEVQITLVSEDVIPRVHD